MILTEPRSITGQRNMTHKVHPKIFRIKKIDDWDSRWLTKRKFSEYLRDDWIIRKFLENRLKEAGVQNIEIERSENKINIIINTSRPGIIIGRGGEGLDSLKKELEKSFRSENRLFFKRSDKIAIEKEKEKLIINFEIREIKNFWVSSSLVAQWIASRIEKRIRYRKVCKQALEKIALIKEVKGVKLKISGRLDGKEIARKEWFRKGKFPLQTIRADVDYAEKKAHCSYGIIGIKVWIYKGEKF